MSDSVLTGGAEDSDAAVFHLRMREDFQLALQWQGQHCVLLPASPRWVELDYAAVMACREQLQGLFGAGDAWPPAELTQADDQADLAWHAAEFEQGKSFAYSLLRAYAAGGAGLALGAMFILRAAALPG